MQITKNLENERLTLAVSGRIDTSTAPELESVINNNAQNVKELIIDLKDMDYISSAGLRVLLKTQKLMNTQGSLLIKNVQSDVMEIFEMTGFVDILTIE